jgi:hypothetical protein
MVDSGIIMKLIFTVESVNRTPSEQIIIQSLMAKIFILSLLTPLCLIFFREFSPILISSVPEMIVNVDPRASMQHGLDIEELGGGWDIEGCF